MTRGACASGDIYSAKAGAQVLAAGGNAADAAVAAGLMACASLPTMTGLGGAGIFTLRMDGKVEALDCFANVPGLGVTHTGPRKTERVTVAFEDVTADFLVGRGSVGVPGTVAGLWALHERHGRMPLRDLAEPAIRAAREGLLVTEAQTRAFSLLAEIFFRCPEAAALLSNGGEGVVQPGEHLTNAALATTLELLVDEGPRAFYEGPIAAAFVEGTDGWVSPEDLRAYRARWTTPIHATYRGRDVYFPGAPCSTGLLVLTALRQLEQGPPLPAEMASEDWWRLADALRAAERVRTPEYEARLFEDAYLPALVSASASGNTMQCATADSDGNLVSYTTTVGESAGRAAPGMGFVLNNFLGEEDINPHGAEPTPGHRMMTSMCPTLVGRDRHWLAVGSAGSSRIRTAIVQAVTNALDRGMPLGEAVQAPRIHVEKGTLFVEGHGRTEDDVAAIRGWAGGPSQVNWPLGFYFGGVQMVAFADGHFDAGADGERRGCAAVVL